MDSLQRGSSRCYICDRTLEECHEYIISIIDGNFDHHFIEFKNGSRVSKALEEVRSRSLENEKLNEFMPIFKTLKSKYGGKSPMIYFNRIMEMKEEYEVSRKNKKTDKRSQEEFRFEYRYLDYLFMDSCNYLKEKFGGWNHEKFKVALELNYNFEGDEAEDLRILFEHFREGDKSVNDITSIAQRIRSELQTFERNDEGWDPWSDARKALKEELYGLYLRDVGMDAVECGELSVPICGVCKNICKNITESLTRYL